MGPPKRTDQETLRRLLDSGKLDAAEGTEIQQALDGLLAGKEVTGQQRLRASVLYERYNLGEAHPVGRKRGSDKRELLAAFDAMPRPKKPPGK
jgi:hypothetical protein